ncbi:MAG: DUF1835 domain-containing protein [Firmicutes bacterium]|nr:DUF1835 domain-containing protein [Bacillota bacterium]
MLEVVFNESASISLMMAQRYGKGTFPRTQGIPGFVFYGDTKPSEEELEQLRADWLAKEQEKREKAVPLGGKGTDVFCFDLLLNIGGIGDDFLEERKHVLKRFAYLQEEAVERRVKDTMIRLDTFCQRVQDGEAVRLWYVRKPEDMCGMTWICYEMCRREVPLDKVNFVEFPKEKLSSGEVSEEEWSQYAALQTLMDVEEIRFCASQWEALREANAPLRVVVNGCVVSATEDFYDGLIWQEVEQQEVDFYQTKLIGRLLDQGIGIRDSWLSYRFDYFLEAEKLELVAVDHECPWIRILRKGETR